MYSNPPGSCILLKLAFDERKRERELVQGHFVSAITDLAIAW
jgi:hypothetical protein